jgi:hypothetical protein
VYQIGDREGFPQLLERLTLLGVQYTVQPVSQQVYDSAQRIRRQRRGIFTDSGHAAAAHQDDDDAGDAVRTVTRYRFDHCGEVEGEDSVLLSRPAAAAADDAGASGCCCWEDKLMTTPREAFVLLTATR